MRWRSQRGRLQRGRRNGWTPRLTSHSCLARARGRRAKRGRRRCRAMSPSRRTSPSSSRDRSCIRAAAAAWAAGRRAARRAVNSHSPHASPHAPPPPHGGSARRRRGRRLRDAQQAKRPSLRKGWVGVAVEGAAPRTRRRLRRCPLTPPAQSWGSEAGRSAICLDSRLRERA